MTRPFRIKKSGKERLIALNAAVARELEAWRQWFREEIARASERAASRRLTPQLRAKAESRLEILRRCEPRPNRLVFPSFKAIDEHGEAKALDNVDNGLKAVIREAGLDRSFGLHVLRHTFAVTLAREGVPILKLSKALGHSNTRVTETNYLRFFPDEGADVTLALPDLEAAPARIQAVGF